MQQRVRFTCGACLHTPPDYINQDDYVILYIHCFSKLFFFTMNMPVFTKQQEN